jgi:hypothetical protein
MRAREEACGWRRTSCTRGRLGRRAPCRVRASGPHAASDGIPPKICGIDARQRAFVRTRSPMACAGARRTADVRARDRAQGQLERDGCPIHEVERRMHWGEPREIPDEPRGTQRTRARRQRQSASTRAMARLGRRCHERARHELRSRAASRASARSRLPGVRPRPQITRVHPCDRRRRASPSRKPRKSCVRSRRLTGGHSPGSNSSSSHRSRTARQTSTPSTIRRDRAGGSHEGSARACRPGAGDLRRRGLAVGVAAPRA